MPGIDAAYLAVDPTLPAPLSWLQRVTGVRTLVNTIVYCATLLVRLPRYDVVHIYSASYWSFLLAPAPALVIGRLLGKRVVLNYHSGEAEDHLQRWGWHAKPLLRLADSIVVPTKYLVEVFARHGLAASAIPNHIDVSKLRHRTRATVSPRYLSNRNFEKHYNVCAVIDAFAAVQASHPDAALVIAGGGPLRGALEAQVAALKLRNVRFTGPVPPDAMPALYDDADVFVNASLIDNMPLSLLEAYGSGLPVVTSDAGGIPWIAADGETARVVPAGDVGALTAGMLDVIRDPAAALTRARAAHTFVTEQFSWDAVRARWQDAYVVAR
jgi:L-malate glycosyltransferase